MWAALVSGAVFGALNFAHCASMCGPLAAVGCGRSGSFGRFALARYQLGRTLTYMFGGAMAGHFGAAIALHAPGWANAAFAILAAAACVLAALRLLPRATPLVPLRVDPRSETPRRSLRLALMRLLPSDPLVLGLASFALPCGLLAAALLAAAATGSASSGATFMTGFAATSGIAIVGAGWLVRLAPSRGVLLRSAMAALLIGCALVALARPLAAATHGPAGSNLPRTCHQHAP